MEELLKQLVKELLKSLYILFDQVPAFDMLHKWFGRDGTGLMGSAIWILLSGAAFGVLVLILFLWVLRRVPRRSADRRPKAMDLLAGVEGK